MLVHLMLELYGIDRDILIDAALMNHVLNEYPSRIGMTKVSPASLYQIATPHYPDSGLSGFVIIAESHVSLHTWPEYGEVDIDVCSCKEFNHQDALSFAKDIFQTEDVEFHFIERATRSLRIGGKTYVRE